MTLVICARSVLCGVIGALVIDDNQARSIVLSVLLVVLFSVNDQLNLAAARLLEKDNE